MSAITVIGVDLAKNTFQLHGVDAKREARVRSYKKARVRF